MWGNNDLFWGTHGGYAPNIHIGIYAFHPLQTYDVNIFYSYVLLWKLCVCLQQTNSAYPTSNCSNRNTKSWTSIMLMFQSFSTLSGLSASVFYLLYYVSDILDVHSLHGHQLMMKSTSNGPLKTLLTVFPTNISGGLAVKVSDVR